MKKNILWIIAGFSILGFISFVLCGVWLQFISPSFVPLPPVYDERYYQQQPKVNGLKFDKLNKAAKIEVLFPLTVSDKDVVTEEADKVEFTRQFFQSYADGWVELHEQKAEVTGGTISIHFYDSNNRELEYYQLGPNRLIYRFSYWRYIDNGQLMPLLEKLGIQSEYEALYKQIKGE